MKKYTAFLFVLSIIGVANAVAMHIFYEELNINKKIQKKFENAHANRDWSAISDHEWAEISPFPLHLAAELGRHKIMEKLLLAGADPNQKTENNSTPLHCVTTEKGARILTAHRACRIDECDIHERTPLAKVLFGRTYLDHETMQWKNIATEWKEIATLLLKLGANINVSVRTYDTLLHRAVHENNSEIVDFLLGNKINYRKHDSKARTAFDVFIQERRRWPECMFAVFEKHGLLFFPGVRPLELLKVCSLHISKIRACLDSMRSCDQEMVTSINNWARLFMCAKKYKSSGDAEMRFNEDGCIVARIAESDLDPYFGQDGRREIENILGRILRSVAHYIKYSSVLIAEKQIEIFPWVLFYDSSVAHSMMKDAIKNKDLLCLITLLKSGRHLHRLTDGGMYLHEAVEQDNPDALKVLIEYGIDCLEKGNYMQSPLEYAVGLKRGECATILNKELCEQWGQAVQALDYKRAKRLLADIIDCNVVLNNKQSLLFNLVTQKPYSKSLKMIPLLVAKEINLNDGVAGGLPILWELMRFDDEELPVFKALLDAGAGVNYSRFQRNSLLGLALLREDLPLVGQLFLDYGGVVEKKMLDNCPEKLKAQLQCTYDKQKCCVCWEHPDDRLSNLPCKGRGHGEYICRGCYDGIKMEIFPEGIKYKTCPICRGALNGFGT